LSRHYALAISKIVEETPMRRNFIKSAASLAALSALPLTAQANVPLKMMIPANPGGGWDGTGRALGKALIESGAASNVSFENKGGAAGAIGLAQFVNANKNDPNALMVMGAVMLGGMITTRNQQGLSQVTPIARLTSEYNVFVVPAQSPFKTMKDVVDAYLKDPASVKWAGGSRGSTEHIAAAMLSRQIGVEANKVNYVPFRGGGEAIAAILGGNVSVAGSGYSEFAEYIKAGKMRAIAVTAPKRLPGIDVPTMKEQGYDIDIGNWRGVYGASGISAADRKTLTERVIKATKSKAWQDALSANGWTPALLTGSDFDQFVEKDFASLRVIMYKSGMISDLK
jgi:putative tricarboxylic transport membrane protein